mgnify:CR=1 FL=1
MINMTLTVYVRGSYGRIDVVTAKERERIINENAEDRFQDEAERNDWINDNYAATDFLNCESTEKLTEKILDDWRDECYEWAASDFDGEWDETSIEVDKEELEESANYEN